MTALFKVQLKTTKYPYIPHKIKFHCQSSEGTEPNKEYEDNAFSMAWQETSLLVLNPEACQKLIK